MLKITSWFFISLLSSPLLVMAETEIYPRLEQLIADINLAKEQYDIPAVSVVIVDPENIIWSGTLGLADRKSAKIATEDTLFRIGSITKMFTGLAMAMLAEDGLLKLDDNVKDLMPDFPFSNPWKKTHPVKIAHFIEHTSGLTKLSSEEFNNTKQMELKQAIMWKADLRVAQYPPGTHRVYSNAGPGFAAYLLEHITNKKYEDFVKERIFTPLHLQSASFFPDEKTLKDLATGYDNDAYSVIPYWHTIYRAFGGINIKPIEMANFLRFLLNKGDLDGQRLVSQDIIRRMETPTSTLSAKGGLKFGYGLGIYSYLRKGNLFYGHGGDADGYLSRLGYNRDKKLGYFLVINVFDHKPLTKIRRLIEDYIVANEIKEEAPLYKLTDKELKLFTGEYEIVAARFFGNQSRKRLAKIILERGQLIIDSGKKNRLFPVTKNHFRYKGESVATSAFVYDDEGKLYFQDNYTNYKRINTKK